MAIGIGATDWERGTNLILAEKGAADYVGHEAEGERETNTRRMSRTSEGREPALTSPAWRAWTPGAPKDQMTTVAR